MRAGESSPRFLDTHCHLQNPRFAEGLESVLTRARAAGVTGFVCCGTREEDWNAVLELAAHHADIVPMLGLHPWFVGEAREGWRNRLEDLFRTSQPFGVGECGLDFALPEADRATQETAFRAQLRLAVALDRPLSIHCRRAWERLITLAREEGLPAAGAVIHAYSGSAEVAHELQALGFHLAFGASLLSPENRRAAKAVVAVDADRLLFETDAPDMAPLGWEADRPNEPANIMAVAQAAARLRGEDAATLAARVHIQSLRLFGDPHP